MNTKLSIYIFFLLFINILSFQQNEIDKIFAHYQKPNSPGCQVSINRNGQKIFQKGYGLRNIEENLSNNDKDLPFAIASISKQFTGLAIAMLIEEGKLSEDDSITKFLPDIPTFGHEIKLHHLLHHTSGYKSYDMARILSDRDLDYWSESEAMENIKRHTGLNHLPGDQFSYTNTGFFLLAKIVEKIENVKFSKFCQDNIFGPLGMTKTIVLDEFNTIIPKLTQSYQYRNKKIMKDIKILDKSVIGSAGIITTLEDMEKYDKNIYNNKLRGGANLINRWLSRRRLNNGKLNPYAYGVGYDTSGDMAIISHGGSISGYRSQYVLYPDHKLSFIVFCNHENANPIDYAEKLTKLFIKNNVHIKDYEFVKPQSSKIEQGVARQDLKDYEGFYVAKEIKAIYHFIPENGLLKLPFNTFGDLHFRVFPNESFVCVQFPFIAGVFKRSNQKVNGFIYNPFRFSNVTFVKYETKPDCFF